MLPRTALPKIVALSPLASQMLLRLVTLLADSDGEGEISTRSVCDKIGTGDWARGIAELVAGGLIAADHSTERRRRWHITILEWE